MEKRIHPSLLEVIHRVIDQLLDEKTLYRFLEKAENSHSSQRVTMLGIVTRALKNVDNDAALASLSRIGSRKRISNEMIELLANTVKEIGVSNI